MSEKQALNAKEWEESEGYVYVGCGGVSKLVGGKWKAFSRHEAMEAYAAACTQLQAERIAELERSESQLIDERDAAEEAISQAYFLIKGESPEWSNLFGHDEALEEIDDAQKCLRAEIKSLEQRLVSLQTTNENFRETLRGIRSMNPATEGARMKLWASDSLSGHTDSVEGTVKKLSDERNALQTENEQLRKGWIRVEERTPEPSVWVLGWLYLPKNPPASGPCLVQYSGCVEDEPEGYGDHRRTVGCWWGNGMYYERGHVTHWQPLPSPPNSNNDTDGQHQ